MVETGIRRFLGGLWHQALQRVHIGTWDKRIGFFVHHLFVCRDNLSRRGNTHGTDRPDVRGVSMKIINLFVFIGGLLFGFGLAFGGMAQPEIVLSFLELKDLGLLVLLGASAFVTALTINLIPKVLKRPFLGGEFEKRKRRRGAKGAAHE